MISVNMQSCKAYILNLQAKSQVMEWTTSGTFKFEDSIQ